MAEVAENRFLQATHRRADVSRSSRTSDTLLDYGARARAPRLNVSMGTKGDSSGFENSQQRAALPALRPRLHGAESARRDKLVAQARALHDRDLLPMLQPYLRALSARLGSKVSSNNGEADRSAAACARQGARGECSNRPGSVMARIIADRVGATSEPAKAWKAGVGSGRRPNDRVHACVCSCRRESRHDGNQGAAIDAGNPKGGGDTEPPTPITVSSEILLPAGMGDGEAVWVGGETRPESSVEISGAGVDRENSG